jgi:hypothetical protein
MVYKDFLLQSGSAPQPHGVGGAASILYLTAPNGMERCNRRLSHSQGMESTYTESIRFKFGTSALRHG